jgi:hypothetical protein
VELEAEAPAEMLGRLLIIGLLLPPLLFAVKTLVDPDVDVPALAKTPFGRGPVDANPELTGRGLLLEPIPDEENIPPDGDDELLTAALANTPLGRDPVKTDELTPGRDAVVNT